METIATRIIQIVNMTGGNKSEFARRIGVTPAYISKLDKEPERTPSDRTIKDICLEFRVNETWLRTGEGDPFNVPGSREEEIEKFVNEALADESDSFKVQLLHALAQLTDDQWTVLADIADLMAQEQSGADPPE